VRLNPSSECAAALPGVAALIFSLPTSWPKPAKKITARAYDTRGRLYSFNPKEKARTAVACELLNL
jgi:hypothetical protein